MNKEKWLDDKGNEITEEYIIVNKTAIQNRIDELKVIERNESMNGSLLVREEIETLERVIYKSTPLIPEIEKTWDASLAFNAPAGMDSGINKQDYISNLKLNI